LDRSYKSKGEKNETYGRNGNAQMQAIREKTLSTHATKSLIMNTAVKKSRPCMEPLTSVERKEVKINPGMLTHRQGSRRQVNQPPKNWGLAEPSTREDEKRNAMRKGPKE